MTITRFRGEYSYLSNFYECPFTAKVAVCAIITPALSTTINVSFKTPTVEHAFQALKTADLGEMANVLAADTPGEAKRLGRAVTLRPDWEGAKDAFMTALVRQKFDSSWVLRKNLISTAPEELIEGNSWGDRYWGLCNGTGLNKLGKILMQIRDFYLNSDEDGPAI